jgi:hypothetical protein
VGACNMQNVAPYCARDLHVHTSTHPDLTFCISLYLQLYLLDAPFIYCIKNQMHTFPPVIHLSYIATASIPPPAVPPGAAVRARAAEEGLGGPGPRPRVQVFININTSRSGFIMCVYVHAFSKTL